MKKLLCNRSIRFLLLLLMCSLLWGVCGTKTKAATASAPLYKFGDVNHDGKIDTTDMVKILRHIDVESSVQSLIDHPDWKLEGNSYKAADVNQDGKVTEADRDLVLNHIAAQKNGSGALIVTVTLKDSVSGSYYGCFPVIYNLSASTKGYYPSLKTVTKTGYTFSGWYTASSGGSRIYSGTSLTNKNDHILYAQWTKNKYTLYFNANGGACTTSSRSIYYNDTYGTLPTAAKSGYTFLGWYTSSTGGSKVYSTTKMSVGNKTVYARWQANTYKVTFDANGGTCDTGYKYVTYNQAYGTLPSPTRTDYRFLGWYTAATGGNKITSSSYMTLTSGHTLYAQWEIQPNTTSIMPRTAFGLNYYDPGSQECAIQVSTFKNSTGTQVQLQNASKQTIATTTGRGNTTVFFSGLSSQKIYYYRARAYYDISGSRIYGAWSYRRAFSTCTVSVINGGSYSFRVQAPKTDGVSKFELWVSAQSSQKGFKKVGNIKPGQAIKLSKVNGNTLSSYGKNQKFYFFIKPYLNSGETDGIYQRPGWSLNSASGAVKEWYKQILNGNISGLYAKCQEWNKVVTRYVYLRDFTYYNVTDINNDGIDELILATPRSRQADDNRILYLTYYQGKITPLICFDGNGARGKVKVKNNQIVLLNSESTGAYHIVYKINNDQVIKVKDMEYINEKYNKRYFINGRSVTASRWNNESNNLYDLKDISFKMIR